MKSLYESLLDDFEDIEKSDDIKDVCNVGLYIHV